MNNVKTALITGALAGLGIKLLPAKTAARIIKKWQDSLKQ